jgi:hypothetical protein
MRWTIRTSELLTFLGFGTNSSFVTVSNYALNATDVYRWFDTALQALNIPSLDTNALTIVNVRFNTDRQTLTFWVTLNTNILPTESTLHTLIDVVESGRLGGVLTLDTSIGQAIGGTV